MNIAEVSFEYDTYLTMTGYRVLHRRKGRCIAYQE